MHVINRGPLIDSRFSALVLLVPLVLLVSTGCGGASTVETPDGSQGGSTGAGGSGGAPGTAGNTGQPIDASATCSAGTVTFHMSAADPASRYCVGLRCSQDWMVIESPAGAFPLSLGCNTTCDDCRAVACPDLCAAPVPMQADGEHLTWDGTYWPSGTCAGGTLGCRDKKCAPPGRYLAKMCAAPTTPDSAPAGFCMPGPTTSCVEVEFDYPGTATVEGLLK